MTAQADRESDTSAAGGQPNETATPTSGAARARRGATREGDLRIAAIDIGSNSVRQIIADVSPAGTITVVDEMKAAPRLGTGMDASGALNAAAVQRAISAIEEMATLARRLGADRIEVVATSAVREAENRVDFVNAVRNTTGLAVRILSGEEEARLSHLSAVAHFDLTDQRAVVMDIGGGSMELALSAGGVIEKLTSLPFGALRLTEQFLGSRPDHEGVRALRRFVRDDIHANLSKRDWSGAQIIGSGGTFTNLGAILLARRGMSIARGVHATRVPREEVEHILSWLAAMTSPERAAVQGLNPARADIIVAGIAVAAEVLARLDAREVTVSGYGIREGLLLETASVIPATLEGQRTREKSVREFAERCRYAQPHSEHVQKLALQLFDALGERIGCTPDERQLLSDAALLHDVGYHINYDQHHKHSYHLIVHADLLGMSPEEQLVIANIARYHRGSEPKRRHENFGSLDARLRERIVRLSALLRVADGFDRGHMGAVERVDAEWTTDAIRLHASPAPGAVAVRLELWGAQRKSGLLASVAGRPVRVVGADDMEME